MEKLNIKDIQVIPVNGDTENSAILFETSDGKPLYWDGHEFYVDDIFEGFDIEYYGLVIGGIYGEDEETWEEEANKQLADMGVKLGKHHEWSPEMGEWYELESL